MGEVLFPGVLVMVCGLLGLFTTWRPQLQAIGQRDDRETVMLYGSLGVLALWASFGPPAGLYTLLYRVVPLFTFLRAPSRFGLLVVFVLAMFSSLALARMLSPRRSSLVALLLGVFAIAELNVRVGEHLFVREFLERLDAEGAEVGWANSRGAPRGSRRAALAPLASAALLATLFGFC